MYCPYCGDPLELYETETTYSDDEILRQRAGYFCTECSKEWFRNETYKLISFTSLEVE